jgi:hypothetical protein
MEIEKFKDLIIENSEVLLDQMLKDGLLKDIPIISNLVGLYNVKSTISDKIFYNKVVSFYNSFFNVDRESFTKWKIWANENTEKSDRIASSLVLHIDAQNEIIKCKALGHLFKKLVEERMAIEEFEYFNYAISTASTRDLRRHCVDGGDASQSNEAGLCQRLQFIGFYNFTSESLDGKKNIEYEISERGVKFIDIMNSFDWH